MNFGTSTRPYTNTHTMELIDENRIADAKAYILLYFCQD